MQSAFIILILLGNYQAIFYDKNHMLKILTSIFILINGFSCAFAGNTTISFWYLGSGDDAVMHQRWASRFAKETGINVKVTAVGWGNFEQKYLTAMAAELPPDVGTTSMNGPFEYGKVGAVIDIKDRFPEDYRFLKNELCDGGWEGLTFKNHVFGVPAEMSTVFMYYRKDIFHQLGITVPRTWSELEHVLDIINANDLQYGFVWPRDAGWALGMYSEPLGVGRYTRDGTKVTWKDPRFQQAFKFAIQLWNRWNMPVSLMEQYVDLFSQDISKKGVCMPMYFDLNGRYSEIRSKWPGNDDKWGIAPFPSADNGKSHTVFGGTAWVIFRKTKHPEAAMKWIRYCMSKKQQKDRIIDTMIRRGQRNALFLSPNKAVWDDQEIPLNAETITTVKKALGSVHSSSPVLGAGQADRELDLAIERIREKADRYLSRTGNMLNMSRWELRRAFAAGEYKREKARFINFLNKTCETTLAEIAPNGNADLARGREEFEKYYANILEKKEKQFDILDASKILAGALILISIFSIIMIQKSRRQLDAYLFIAPSVLLFLIFLLIPIAISIYIAFTKYNPVLPLAAADWIGLKNFKDVLGDPKLWQSLWRSLKFAIFMLPVQLFIGIALAVGLDQGLRPDKLFKFFYFSPLVTSTVSVSLIWSALYLGARYGWINAGLLSMGLVRDPIHFLSSPDMFLKSVIIMSIWHGLAFVILINLAGLQNIPTQLYEAARIDGAGTVAQFFKITLPALRPQITFLIVMGTIGAMQVFEQIYILGGGSDEPGTKFGPNDSGMTIVPYIFRKGFEDMHMGEASAVAYILFIILLLLTTINWKFLKSSE